jgi:hypothetical protein
MPPLARCRAARATLQERRGVAMSATGVPPATSETVDTGDPQGPHVSLMSNHPELSWVHPVEAWARGVVDVSTGQVHVTAYAV